MNGVLSVWRRLLYGETGETLWRQYSGEGLGSDSGETEKKLELDMETLEERRQYEEPWGSYKTVTRQLLDSY